MVTTTFKYRANSELRKAFERHGEKNGCHVVEVPPEGTTKRCAKCGVESEKPLWVREHSCPSCGYETDRDHNSSIEVQRLGLEDLGVDFEREELFEDANIGLGQSESTSVETGISESARHRDELLSNSLISGLVEEAEILIVRGEAPTYSAIRDSFLEDGVVHQKDINIITFNQVLYND